MTDDLKIVEAAIREAREARKDKTLEELHSLGIAANDSIRERQRESLQQSQINLQVRFF